MDAERAEFLAPIPSRRTPRSARGPGLPDNEAFAAPAGPGARSRAAAPGGQHLACRPGRLISPRLARREIAVMVTVAYVSSGVDAGGDDAIAVILVVDLLVLWLTCWCFAALMRSRVRAGQEHCADGVRGCPRGPAGGGSWARTGKRTASGQEERSVEPLALSIRARFVTLRGCPDCSSDRCMPCIPGGRFSAVLLAMDGGLVLFVPAAGAGCRIGPRHIFEAAT